MHVETYEMPWNTVPSNVKKKNKKRVPLDNNFVKCIFPIYEFTIALRKQKGNYKMQEPDGTLNTDISLPYAFCISPYLPLFKIYARTDNWISNCFLSGQSDAKIAPAPYSNKVRLISEISPSHDLLRH